MVSSRLRGLSYKGKDIHLPRRTISSVRKARKGCGGRRVGLAPGEELTRDIFVENRQDSQRRASADYSLLKCE